MARSQASNLSGMLTSIGDTMGKMGDVGNQYVDTFRRTMAPEADMNDSASLLRYADWARRNGYDEEAKQYMALGYRQKEVEAEKAQKARVRSGETANMYNRGRIAQISADPTLSPLKKRELIQDAMAAQQAVATATGGDPSKWDSGTAALAAVGQEEADLSYNKKINNLQTMITEVENRAEAATEKEKPTFEASLEKLYETLNEASAEKGKRLGDTMRNDRRTRMREDASDARAENQDDRADRAEARAEISLRYSVAAAQAEAAETAAIAQGTRKAAELIANGQYELTEDDLKVMPPKAIFEANGLLETARKNAAAIETATMEGTVQPEMLEQARILAKTDSSIATLLKNYETVKAQSVHGDASKGPAQTLAKAVVARNKATAEAGRDVQVRGAVGARMQALLDEGDFSSFLDGYDDYADVMRNEEDFTEMRNAVATLVKEQNLTSEDLTPETLFELMDTAAPGLSDSWRKANDRLSRMRRKALTGWKSKLVSDGKTYRDNVIKEYSGKTQWEDAELDRIAGQHYETAIDFYTRLINSPIEEQEALLFRSLVGNESIFKPRQIGRTGGYMPPIMSEEEGKAMYDQVRAGEPISINSFTAE